MALPPGVTTTTVTYGKALGYLATPARIEAVLTADRDIVHAATGWSLHSANEPVKATTDAELTFVVPHVDQDGFVDASQNGVTNWAYTLSGNLIFPTKTIAFKKTFQVFVGQATLDLDLVPDGPALPGVTAPNTIVLAAEAARDDALDAAAEASASAASIQREQASGVAGLTSAGKLYEARIPDRLADARLAKLWEPNTAYALGQTVQAPDGSIVKAKAAFTSGATYSAANWTSAATYAGTQAQSELSATYVALAGTLDGGAP